MENIYRTVLQVVSFVMTTGFILIAVSFTNSPSELGGLKYEEDCDQELYNDAIDRLRRAKHNQVTIFWYMSAAIVFAGLLIWATVS